VKGWTRIREALDRSVELAERVVSTSPLVFNGDGQEGMKVALSFDDGPSPANTPRILDILGQHDARATFFVLGERIEGCEDVLARMAKEGHEVGNHTFTHPHTIDLRPGQITAELSRTNEALAALSIRPRLLRPPYGKDRRRIASAGRVLDMTVVLWSIDSGDTRGRSAKQINDHVLEKARPGAIVLLHDGGDQRPATIAAVEELVPALINRGFDLVTVTELLAPSG
jgi:peptidoglycan/xylan/chitin deacetylase (PgdA/CDA1 family)